MVETRRVVGLLVEGLKARRQEIEQAVLTRVYSVSDPTESFDPAYVEGLRVATAAALDYGIAGIEHGESRATPIPTALYAQARDAARNGVSLDTVLRRYFAGYALLNDILFQEVGSVDSLQAASLRRPWRDLAALFDRVVAAVAEEYMREAGTSPVSAGGRRADLVRRLLAGELLDPADLAYPLDCWHVAVIAGGHEPAKRLRELATAADRRLLLVEARENTVWGWFGGREKMLVDDIVQLVARTPQSDLVLAFGEASSGEAGWRLTHYQASAAWLIGQRRRDSLVRYMDISLLASMLHDDVLTRSLRQLYLAPLAVEHGDGTILIQTLQAYFDAGRNVTSAAAALGVSRKTVTNRLREVEQRLNRPLAACALELQVALDFELNQDFVESRVAKIQG